MGTGETVSIKLNTTDQTGARSGRLFLLDALRGLTLLSMILYHFGWDLIFLGERPLASDAFVRWYNGRGGFFWQQSICWTFILLSGFCIPFSGRLLKRGIQVSLGGLAVTSVTCLFLWEDRVIFGVLTFLGAAMLLMLPVRRINEGTDYRSPLRESEKQRQRADRIDPVPGLVLSLVLFWLFRDLNCEVLGFWPFWQVHLPSSWFHGLPMTFLGFQEAGFVSTDYFSVLPWFFLYLSGYFLCRWLRRAGVLSHPLLCVRLPLFSALGRHSLLIYLLHQPALYVVFLLLERMTG